MKIALRNFMQTLRRYRTASALNVAGLTLAFTAFYIILVQIWWEVGYNRSLTEVQRIYLVEVKDWFEPADWSSWVNRPILERAIASAPDVESGGCMRDGFEDGTCWTRDEKNYGYKKFTVCSSSMTLPLLDLFSFRPVKGDVHDLAQANSVIVSRVTAERLNVGIGDMLWIDCEQPESGKELKVVAVFEDFPDNSMLKNCQAVKNLGDDCCDDDSQWSFNYFVRLRPGADSRIFERHCEAVDRTLGGEIRAKALAEGKTSDPGDDQSDTTFTAVRLARLTDLYFDAALDVPFPRGSAATTYTLLGIAVLIVVVAFINFVNFFFALVPMRVRTVNTFKVFGAPVPLLRFSFLFEAFGLVALSLLIAWYLGSVLQGSEFANYVSAPLALSQNLPVVSLLAVVAFALALAASLYPAYYITSFAPMLVVKGAFGGSHGGRRLRAGLLCVQFFIALSLIICTGLIRLQHSYMMHYDMGFDRQGLLAVKSTKAAARKFETLRSQLLADPRIGEVIGASSRMVSANRMGWGREFKDRQIDFQCYPVTWNFLKVMGIRITEGRDFLESDVYKQQGTLIFNETAKREFGIALGDRMIGFTLDEPVVGFCADFNFKPLQYPVGPFAFYVVPAKFREEGYHLPTTVYVRVQPESDVAEVADRVRKTITALDPHAGSEEITVRDFEAELGAEYEKERRLADIVGAFSLLAVVIALMGVFGIVFFETQHRRREIAVRRVMGATVCEILAMFNVRYLRIVAVCFILAAPVCIWAVSRWLSTFTYRAPITWWIFALSFAAVAGITLLTVTVCIWRTASENPAESIKSE